MKNSDLSLETSQNPYPSPFMGNYFCEIAHYNAAFVAISKNAVTYLKNIAIYTKTGSIAANKDEVHDWVGYTPGNGYLHPVKDYDEEWGRDIVKFAIWRDPVERLVSCYKHFCLERHCIRMNISAGNRIIIPARMWIISFI